VKYAQYILKVSMRPFLNRQMSQRLAGSVQIPTLFDTGGTLREIITKFHGG